MAILGIARRSTVSAKAQDSVLFHGLWGVLMLLLSLIVLVASLPHFNMENPRFNLPNMLNGQADRPFVYRVLVPVLVTAITDLLPVGHHDTTNDDGFFDRAMPKAFSTSPQYTQAAEVTFVIMWGFLFLFAFAFQYLFLLLFDVPKWVAVVLSGLAILGVHFLAWEGQIYDFSTLALFTLGYIALVQRRWMLYTIFFAFACMNKETAPFLTFVFLLWTFRDGITSRALFLRMLLLQGVVYGLVRVTLIWRFGTNPGGDLEFHLWTHIKRYMHPLDLPHNMVLLGALLFFVLFIRYRFAEQPVFLRRAIWLSLPVIGLYLFFGFPYEIRVFYEVYPIAVLMVCYTAARVLRWPIARRVEPVSLQV